MPRLRRLIPTGKVFFVTTNLRRGLRHWTPGERTILCKVLNTVRARRDFRLAGFVIMPDHAHWLALPRPEDTLSTIVQQWKRISAMKLNSLRRTRETLWQKGFFDRFMRTPQEFLETLEYIHQNPVQKGLVAIPTDWDWSSARAYADGECIIKIDFLNLPAQTEKPLP